MEHALYIFYMHHLPILEGMFWTIKKCYDTISSTCYTFYHYLYWLLPIFIYYFKFVTKVIQYTAICTSELCAYEFYVVFSALLV